MTASLLRIALLAALCCLFPTVMTAGTEIFLKLDGSNRTVAQMKADADGVFSFANLPDGKYKLDVVVATKRFSLDADCDADGNPDFVINATANPAGKSLSKTLRMLITEKGQKKTLTMSEWMQKSSAHSTWQTSGGYEIAIEITVTGNTIKGKIRCSDGACL